ncbi:MAG: transketolase [Candidatus Paceibacterota bacterium]|jgi:transketolase
MALSSEKIEMLEKTAWSIRRSVVHMLIEARSGHLAGALGMADIFTYLYFHTLKHDPKNPSWPMRDRLVLSNGHICPALYATLAEAGYFPMSDLMTLRKLSSHLQGHPHREWLPALETSSGPLGCGLSQTVGMALADRIDNGKASDRHFYCLMSDGELDEGNTWEGIMLGAKEKLQNITAIIDRNKIQIDGPTEDIMPLDPIGDKWRAFNWHVQEIDGHDFGEIDKAINEARLVTDRPSVIIANTIPSKGIPEFEGRFEWHGKAPTTKEEIEIALRAFPKE